MRAARLFCSLLAALALIGGCAAPSQIALVHLAPTDASAPGRYKTVLIAGDGRLPVFDNAVGDVEARLDEWGGGTRADIVRLSAAPAAAADGARSATLRHVLAAVAAMKPAAGQGCFVFATSHGSAERGLWLQATNEYLNPRALDRALAQGCGDAPTAVVISGCFTGIFAMRPMTRANRVILTAASADRTSFGCGAGRTYTAYDKCLLDALDAGGTWRRAYGAIRRCVADEERRNDVEPSEPQAWFGAGVRGLKLPVQPFQ